MRAEIKWTIFLIGVGASMAVFAFVKLNPRPIVESEVKKQMVPVVQQLNRIESRQKVMDQRIYDLHTAGR